MHELNITNIFNALIKLSHQKQRVSTKNWHNEYKYTKLMLRGGAQTSVFLMSFCMTMWRALVPLMAMFSCWSRVCDESSSAFFIFSSSSFFRSFSLSWGGKGIMAGTDTEIGIPHNNLKYNLTHLNMIKVWYIPVYMHKTGFSLSWKNKKWVFFFKFEREIVHGYL